MKSSIWSGLNKAFLPVFLTAFIVAMPFAASAQNAPTEGCAPEVWDAMKAKSEAKVAYDVAVTEQIIKKPDSVLAMTCFNKAAGASARLGGEVFSGDLTKAVGLVIPDALNAFYDDFKGSAATTMNIPGYGNVPLETQAFTMPSIDVTGFINNVLSGLGLSQATINTVVDIGSVASSYVPQINVGGSTIDFSAGTVNIPGVGNFNQNSDGTLSMQGANGVTVRPKPSIEYGEAGVLIPDTADYECNGVKDLWARVQTEGIQGGVPSVSFQDLINGHDGTVPADVVPDSVMAKNWQASQPIFENLKDKVDALPAIDVPDFTGQNGATVCDVLVTAGVTTGPCN